MEDYATSLSTCQRYFKWYTRIMDINDTTNALAEQRMHRIYDSIAASERAGAAPETWQQAIRIVLHECDHYVHQENVDQWCTQAVSTALAQVCTYWLNRRRENFPPEKCLLSTELLVQLLQSQIVFALIPRVNDDCTRNQQHYLIDHDIGVLGRVPAVITDATLRSQLEHRYPGVLAMAEMTCVLYDDNVSRGQALRAWQVEQDHVATGRDHLTIVDLDALGPVTQES